MRLTHNYRDVSRRLLLLANYQDHEIDTPPERPSFWRFRAPKQTIDYDYYLQSDELPWLRPIEIVLEIVISPLVVFA
ncbi:hypothetical protein D3C79_850570 [compost metagenome]